MRSIGIVRNVDPLGRVVLPKELRELLFIKIKAPLEIYYEDDRIILKPYLPLCVFCGGSEDLKVLNNKKICSDCRTNITNED